MLLAAMLTLMLCAAESSLGSQSVTSHLSFRVVIPPVFRILQVTPIKDGYEYRVWTNRPSILLNGREYRFSSVGETTLTIPVSAPGVFVVHGL
jgi:hypothetical protein